MWVGRPLSSIWNFSRRFTQKRGLADCCGDKIQVRNCKLRHQQGRERAEIRTRKQKENQSLLVWVDYKPSSVSRGQLCKKISGYWAQSSLDDRGSVSVSWSWLFPGAEQGGCGLWVNVLSGLNSCNNKSIEVLIKFSFSWQGFGMRQPSFSIRF